MADTSSDDEVPLAQRLAGGGILLASGGGGAQRPAPAVSSGSDSDIPSWLQAKGKGNQVIVLESSDDDDAVISPAKPAQASQPAAQPAGNRDTQPAAGAQQAAAAPSPKPRSAAKPRATPGRGRTAVAAAAVAAAPAGPEDEAGPPGTQPLSTQATATQATGTQATQATGGGTAQKRAGAAGLPHAATSSMPVVLPDKLPQIKMLVELECSAGGRGGCCCWPLLLLLAAAGRCPSGGRACNLWLQMMHAVLPMQPTRPAVALCRHCSLCCLQTMRTAWQT